MPEHFLLQNTFKLPNEAILRSTQLPEGSMYLTKTCAAPGDDDDYSGIKLVWGPWESLFF